MPPLTVAPGEVRGRLPAPASKSDAQRAIAAAALATGVSHITHFTACTDSLAALQLAASLGAEVERREGELRIRGGWPHPSGVLDCGESGLCLRLFAPIAALSSQPVRLIARGSLRLRSMAMVEEALSAFSVRTRSRGGYPPLQVQGPLRPGRVRITAGGSSQHISGLLFALPLLEEDSEVSVERPVSTPYLAMTLATLNRFGIAIEASGDLSRFRIPGRQSYRPARYPLEGDWSAASFWLVAGAIAGRVEVSRLRLDSPQADREVMSVLRLCGAEVIHGSGKVTTARSPLNAFEWDARDCPDLFPPLTALACYCRGTSRIWGTDRLHGKESDRAAALVEAFRSLGASIRQRGNRLEVKGGTLSGGSVHTHGDHRIAMAAAVAALGSRQGVTLDRPACVSKSYPDFFDHMRMLYHAPGRI